MDQERRVFVEPTHAAGPELLPSSQTRMPRRSTQAGVDSAAEVPIPIEKDREAVEAARASDPIQATAPESADEFESNEHGVEAAVHDGLHSTEPVNETQSVGHPSASERSLVTEDLDGIETGQSLGEKPGSIDPNQIVGSGDRSTSTAMEHQQDVDHSWQVSLESRERPQLSTGRQIVRQVMEWVGDENPRQSVVEAESVERGGKVLPAQTIIDTLSTRPVQQPSVVEQQQSLHLSIGSIVMTLDGSVSEAAVQSNPQRKSQPAPSTAPEPPMRLSRHYLRIR
ncbi:MAG: hypothetical protein P8Y98_15050 [Anaerolineales bacterium]